MNAAGVGLLFASMFLTSFFMPNYWIHFAFTVVLRTAIKHKIAATAAAGPDAGTSPATGEVQAAQRGHPAAYPAYPGYTYPAYPRHPGQR